MVVNLQIIGQSRVSLPWECFDEAITRFGFPWLVGHVLNSFCLHVTSHAMPVNTIKTVCLCPSRPHFCCLLQKISIFILSLALFPSLFALCSILFFFFFFCYTLSPNPPPMSLSQSLSMWVSVRRVVYRCLLSRAGIEYFNLFSSLLSSIRDLETEGEFCSLSVSLAFFFHPPLLSSLRGARRSKPGSDMILARWTSPLRRSN